MIVMAKIDSPIPAGLSEDKAYVVLAISFYTDGRIEVRLPSDGDGLPALYPLSALTIVDGDIPSGWSAAPKRGGGIELSPKEWAAPDFWSRFFDGEQEALDAFEAGACKLGVAGRGTLDS